MITLPEPPALTDGPGWIGVMSQWVAWKLPHLSLFLAAEGTPSWLWRRGRQPPPGLKAIAGIGYKHSSAHARMLCQRWKLPYIALEDGFLRSSSLGVEGDKPLSMVVDPIGIHYLADRPSLLENILQRPDELSVQELATARELIILMRSTGIGKYNNAPDLDDGDELGRDKPLVLVVDQTAGDFSIPGGGLCEADFVRMLDAALAENPGADVRVRIHPDCLGGHKPSCLLAVARARGIPLESRPVSWASLARRAQRVYVGTSQAGLEALIQGVAVTCFGAPFYAGWGLTDDRLPTPRRQGRPDLEQLVAAAYVRYCRYVCPLTGQLTDALSVARQLARRKAQDQAFAGAFTVLGVEPRRHHEVRSLFSSRWGSLRFAPDRPGLLQDIAANGGKLLVWAAREPEGLQAQADALNIALWRIADGLLPYASRHRHTGAAVSLVLDRSGIHYDASHGSDLETRLQTSSFDAATLAQATRLRERIRADGDSPPVTILARPGQQRILVIGRDAALPGDLELLLQVRFTHPNAWIVYRPCRDASLRHIRLLAGVDQIACNAGLGSLYGQIDEVHTHDALAGFEALLHAIPVVTHGAPFYAGWGLTKDRQSFARRTRTLTVEQLVAGVLLDYTRYAAPRHRMPCDALQALELLSPSRRQPWTRRPEVLPLFNYLRTLLGRP